MTVYRLTRILLLGLFFSSVVNAVPNLGRQGGRVVGGTSAVRGEFPFIVSLQNKYGHFCGGSLISDRWVLTAAHCVGNGVPLVVIGLHNQKSSAGTERFVPVRVLRHPNFVVETFAHDFALIELPQNSTFRPIGLNRSELTIGSEPMMGITAGWGSPKESSQSTPNILQKVSLPLVTENECNSVRSYNGRVQKSMFCAGFEVGGKDTCQGDSGGPLVLSIFGEFYLTGIVSWGEGCARKYKYGVYAKITAGMPWISSVTGL